jgi:hypothetical protein
MGNAGQRTSSLATVCTCAPENGLQYLHRQTIHQCKSGEIGHKMIRNMFAQRLTIACPYGLRTSLGSLRFEVAVDTAMDEHIKNIT